MAVFREDTTIYPIMVQMSACLCTEIDDSGLPTPCSCGLMVGELVLDYCSSCKDGKCGGQAWVRLIDAYPSVNFPLPALDNNNCTYPLAFNLEVGIVRCKPLGTANGVRGYNPPSIEQQVKAIRLQTADIAAMRRAINCCLAGSGREYVIQNYSPVPQDADCLGGAFQVTVWQE